MKRRDFLRKMGIGAAVATTIPIVGSAIGSGDMQKIGEVVTIDEEVEPVYGNLFESRDGEMVLDLDDVGGQKPKSVELHTSATESYRYDIFHIGDNKIKLQHDPMYDGPRKFKKI